MLSSCVPAEWLHSCFCLGDHVGILTLLNLNDVSGVVW